MFGASRGHQAIHGWPGPSADGLGSRLAPNISSGEEVGGLRWPAVGIDGGVSGVLVAAWGGGRGGDGGGGGGRSGGGGGDDDRGGSDGGVGPSGMGISHVGRRMVPAALNRPQSVRLWLWFCLLKIRDRHPIMQ